MRFFTLLLLCQLLLFAKDSDALTIVNMHDPFAKPEIKVKTTKTPKSKPTFELNGIFENSAMINDSWLEIGMTTLGYTLKSIDDSGVVLRDDNDVIVLKLYKDWSFQ